MNGAEDVSLEEARLQYQDSRNALFLARLLSVLEEKRESSEELAQIIRRVEHEDGFRGRVPLVNQTTMLQMAYMTLGYPKEGPVGKVLINWKPELEWGSVDILEDSSGRFKEPPAWFQLLRTVRNSLAHSSVEVSEGRFSFIDRHRGTVAAVAFEWGFLGQLTTEFFRAANKVLYPDSAS